MVTLVTFDGSELSMRIKESSNMVLLYHKVFVCGNCPMGTTCPRDDAAAWACHTRYGEAGPKSRPAVQA